MWLGINWGGCSSSSRSVEAGSEKWMSNEEEDAVDDKTCSHLSLISFSQNMNSGSTDTDEILMN